jgi:DtxR family transcriptional regulator, Mn-dependent transcriptional regulator
MRQDTIENYLKNIYHLSTVKKAVVGTFELAKKLEIKPASVTESLRKLHELKYIVYEKSYGSRLTALGARMALSIIRRHRIWETYLEKELGFGWDEVHQIAEELEHIRNDKLINKLSEILGNPSFDPHGDPIPDKKLKFRKNDFLRLSAASPGTRYKVRGVVDHSTSFLKYLEKSRLILGAELRVESLEEYDNSVYVTCNNRSLHLSAKAAANLVVELSR